MKDRSLEILDTMYDVLQKKDKEKAVKATKKLQGILDEMKEELISNPVFTVRPLHLTQIKPTDLIEKKISITLKDKHSITGTICDSGIDNKGYIILRILIEREHKED